jgi:hypothetical protein
MLLSSPRPTCGRLSHMSSVVLPSSRAAVGRGRGWGVSPRVPMAELSTRKHPPPPTPPRHALRAWEEGRNSCWLAGQRTLGSGAAAASSSLPVTVASTYAIALRLRGSVGVFPQNAPVEGIDFPPPVALGRALPLPFDSIRSVEACRPALHI